MLARTLLPLLRRDGQTATPDVLRMKSLQLLPTYSEVACKTESAVCEGLLALDLKLPMACAGRGMCATCHVIVVEGHGNLSPVTAREERTLNMLTNRSQGSRLSCQARLLGDVKVRVPDADYIRDAAELEPMVGKRASRDILHAIDGRVLVARGQIITRYVIGRIRESVR